MVYILTISLLLHGLTILWMMTLAKKISVGPPSGHTENEKVKREIEDLLFAYTSEMKEENERLLHEIKQLKEVSSPSENKSKGENNEQGQSTSLQQDKRDGKTSKSRDDHPQIKKPVNIEQEKDPFLDEKYNDYLPPSPSSNEESAAIFEQSDTANVLMLSKRGLTAEQIAKQLQLGKGEVELILKFYR
ncbi:hypothetical protein RYX45_08640 [Alkalihalophilus pseudofirmus]|uniref:Uncharacterized protein n=1 Tax=Alkalihalophilus pseudofirmus TaxID=79885 RepID=A0AAJ2KWJ1_ALKPS|nr:hypothetical protein [Alkalihalophilus pseudofirmus]MDV2885248.1 hypothetical protein [Alkalihalophilus pseudofirmus]WEG15596.1 hypothetical protein PQ478_13735 [Alkalihalophilus pseudofirmus]